MTDGHTAEDELALLDQVLVEADIDGHPVSFRAAIIRICPTELWLGLASPDGLLETMPADQTVRLTVSRNGTTLVSQSRFLRPLAGSKTRVFAVVWPGVLETVQRRAHVRYQFDWPIHFRRLDPATREPRGKAAGGTTVNVSAGGLLFESDTTVDLDEELELTLPLSGGDGVKMLGVVVRVRQVDEEDSGRNGGLDHTEVAVKFTRITALDQERIVRFILLTEHRRREAGPRLYVQASEQAAAIRLAIPEGDE
jgi:c-di-GMP-binding flagellar brake protein YcgR